MGIEESHIRVLIIIASFVVVINGLLQLTMAYCLRWGRHWIHFGAAYFLVPMLEPHLQREESEVVVVYLVEQFTNRFDQALTIFFIFSGCFLLCSATVGICGVIMDQALLLTIHSIMLTVVQLILVSLTIIFCTEQNYLVFWMTDCLTSTLQRFYDFDCLQSNPNNFTAFVNAYQAANHCCGVNNHTDFHKTRNFLTAQHTLPASCCHQPDDEDCLFNPNQSNSYKSFGCLLVISSKLERLHEALKFWFIFLDLVCFIHILTVKYLFCNAREYLKVKNIAFRII